MIDSHEYRKSGLDNKSKKKEAETADKSDPDENRPSNIAHTNGVRSSSRLLLGVSHLRITQQSLNTGDYGSLKIRNDTPTAIL